jgi:peptide/nickel transport system substrate-binding protein
VLPKHALGPGTAINDASYNAQPIGIGPFRYTAYHRGDDVEMEANPYYWRGRPKLQRVIYKIITDENTLFTQLQTGELDLWDVIDGALAQRVKQLPGLASATRLSDYQEAIYFNTQHAVVADPRVRRALALAVDRPLILAKVALGNGILAQSVVPRMTEGHLALSVAPHDPARAQTLLDAAGWKRGVDGVRHNGGMPLAIELAIPAGQPTRATAAAVLRDAWAAIGVNVTIHPWAAAQYFAPSSAGGVIESGKFDAAIVAGGLGPLYANIDGAFDCASVPPNGFNIAHYCDPRLDALNDRYRSAFEPAERVRIAAAMQQRLNDATPTVVLYERYFLAAHATRLSGYHPSSFSYWGDPLQLDI